MATAAFPLSVSLARDDIIVAVTLMLDPYTEVLASMPADRLAMIVRNRSDVRVRPAPRTFDQLSQRLLAPGQLGAALSRANRDQIAVSQVLASLGGSSPADRLAAALDTTTDVVLRLGSELELSGLGWTSGEQLHQPTILTDHWLADIGDCQPAEIIARKVRVDELRRIVAGLGIDVAGLTKPRLVTALSSWYADRSRLEERILALDSAGLDRLRSASLDSFVFFGLARLSPTEERLIAAGLMLPAVHSPVIPREVAIAAWLLRQNATVSGPPDLPRVTRPPADPAGSDEFAVSLTRVLDQALVRPLTRLKRGGVTRRDLTRMIADLDLSESLVSLCLEVAIELRLLGLTESGYSTTDQYPGWRDRPLAERWASAALAWSALPHLPTAGDDHGPVGSGDGDPRGGLLRAATLRGCPPGHSVPAAVRQLDWYAPLVEPSPELAAAVLAEAELVGVLSGEGWTDAGVALIESIGTDDPAAELAGRLDARQVVDEGRLVLQGDLTAIITGEPPLAIMELLAAAADCETRGAASTWRFSAASVRRGFDQGWTSESLLAELERSSRHSLPQTLRFMITDVARTYGAVTIRPALSCLVAAAPLVAELLAAKPLRKLGLIQLAPTVLASTTPPRDLLAAVRAAGHAPVLHDETGAVLVDRGTRDQPAAQPAPAVQSPTPLPVDELLAQLANGQELPDTETLQRLRTLDHRLNESELILLADSIDQGTDVVINYRNKQGNYSTRAIRPTSMYGRWVVAYCHLRDAEREFTIGNIVNLWLP